MNQEEKIERNLDISWDSIIKIFLGVIILYFTYLVRNILIWFIFALIISVLLEPVVDFLTKKRVPRLVSVVITYLIVFSVLIFLVYLTFPVFSSEIQKFVDLLPQHFERIATPLRALGIKAFEDIEQFTDLISKSLEQMASTIFSAIGAIFGGIFTTFSIFSISLFLSLEEKPIERTLSLIFPKKYEAALLDLWVRCKTKVSAWFLTRILGCIVVGVLSYVAFWILGARYPLSLGAIAGVLNFIPVIGPVLTGILLFVLVSLDQFSKAIFILITFILIQMIENNIVLPALTKRFVGLPPVIVLLALTVGGVLWGFWGAILAIPLFGILFEFAKEFLQKRKEEAVVL